MNAVIVRRYGGPETLEIADVPVPEPGPGQVRVRVQAAAVNPVDLATRAGYLAEAGLHAARPVTAIGWDLAGVVDAVGAGAERFAVGDRVVGLRDLLSAPVGAQAELVVLDEDALGAAPQSATPEAAATLPLNGLTAQQTLELLGLEPGRTLVVTGAAGGLGGFLVQLGALRGLRVIGVAGAADESLVRELGAAGFVDRDADLAQAVRAVAPGGADAVVDAAVVGITAHEALRAGGTYVAVVAGAAPPPLRGTKVLNVWIRQDGHGLSALSALVDAGRLTLRVAETLPLSEVARAHERLEAGGVRGRLVLLP